MNGAIAEPCARTSSPPSSSITMMMGSSQNFLRARRKRHSSLQKGHGRDSVRTGSAARPARARRLALDPVGPGFRLESALHRVPARQAHHHADRRDDDEEHDAEHDRADDAVAAPRPASSRARLRRRQPLRDWPASPPASAPTARTPMRIHRAAAPPANSRRRARRRRRTASERTIRRDRGCFMKSEKGCNAHNSNCVEFPDARLFDHYNRLAPRLGRWPPLRGVASESGLRSRLMQAQCQTANL